MARKPYWKCNNPQCDCRVGCHDGTELPLGTLADRNTRQARIMAHRLLDMLWMHTSSDRTKVYEELAVSMGIERAKCHIGMFNAGQCEFVAAFARARLRDKYKTPGRMADRF